MASTCTGNFSENDPNSAYLRGSVTLEDFIWPESERPTIPFDSFGGEEVPVVDLSLLASSDPRDTQNLAKAMAAAAADWGFFKIVNHNVRMELVAMLETVAHEFFPLPYSQKLLVARNADLPLIGYSGFETAVRIKNWTETLQIPWHKERISKIADVVWTSNSKEAQNFINVVDEYCQALGRLSQLILELLLQGLGADPKCLNEQFGHKSLSTLRLNHYPPCPQPQLTFGTQPHNDFRGLTILHQDSVGGLQVLRNGRWSTIKPEAGSFIVNIGNCLQVWTNSKLKSVLHRAVVNGFASRLSAAFFYNPVDEAVIRPLDAFVDEEHPPKYRTFTLEEYTRGFEKAKANKINPIVPYEIDSSVDICGS